nr:zinc finger, CCHC-type [Tanacetum cinerariifolium]
MLSLMRIYYLQSPDLVLGFEIELKTLVVQWSSEEVAEEYHKTADCYEINSQSDYSSDGCKDNFLECKLEVEVYMNQSQGFIMPGNENKFKFDESGKGVIICLYVDDMVIFGTDRVRVDLTKEFLSSRFSMKDIEEADVILVSTLIDTSEKLMSNNGQAVYQLEYSRVTGCLMYAMTCTRTDITFAVGKLSRYTSNPATGKEAEWLKKFLFEISLWSKPIAYIFICCDSDATLTKAYSQMYNGKSRHLDVRHNMIRELITNGVISIEFVRS